MTPDSRIRPTEIRRLSLLITALTEDGELMAQLSVIQSEQVRGTSEAVRSLFAFVDNRDLTESLNQEG
jgi:hypothetical protein